MKGLRAALCAFAIFWICAGAHAATVRAWLDRPSMQLGETVTLNVEVSGDTGAAQPDLSALAQDFDLLGTQSSTSVNIVNGQTSSKLLWAVGLSPKHEGTLTIPPLNVAGQQTPPLTLVVQAATAGGGQGGDVYIEATLEPRAPYVQQQVLLSVKLYYAVNLLDGNLADPQGDGLIVRKLGQDSNYNANASGRSYHVVERRYAVFPEKSGSLTLAPIVFRGHAAEGNSLDIFFNRGRDVSARSQPMALEVRPRPAASGNDAWLPARSLTLSASGIDASSVARAGEPLTLTLRIKAQGLGFEQLPELKLPAIDGVDIYPDKSTTQNRDDGEWLYGERERKFAIVPNRAGTLALPAISLSWWDTAHDRAETATVPAVTLEVQPAANSPAHAPAPPAANLNDVTPPVTVTPPVAENANDASVQLWRTLAIACLVLWVLTVLVAFLIWRRHRVRDAVPKAPERDSAPRRAFMQACQREDLPAASRALLEWARQTRPGLRNLGELADLLGASEQRAAVIELERSRYGTDAAPRLGEVLQRVFKNGLPMLLPQPVRAPTQPLPNLYPFNT